MINITNYHINVYSHNVEEGEKHWGWMEMVACAATGQVRDCYETGDAVMFHVEEKQFYLNDYEHNSKGNTFACFDIHKQALCSKETLIFALGNDKSISMSERTLDETDFDIINTILPTLWLADPRTHQNGFCSEDERNIAMSWVDRHLTGTFNNQPLGMGDQFGWAKYAPVQL